ncbi:MAG: hypothetical protein JNL82_04060 [Myxococcales bacterium]|nr:hypothetical protein [Myxococcales bacterium]
MTDDDQAWLPGPLRELGYRGKRRDSEWSEVLLFRDRECWHGRGVDPTAALDHALSQMLPSALARGLYDARLAAAAVTATTVASAATTVASAATTVAAAATTVAAADTTPASEPESSAKVAASATSPEPEVRVVEPPKVGQRLVLPTPSYPAAAVNEARETLEDILKEIHEARPDFALMAPRLQKVHMLAWICRARGLDEQFQGEHRVGMLVRRVAHELTNISKIMWPGSVQALQMNARPDCVIAELGLKTIAFPRTWSEASEFVQQHRERALASDAALDDYGWADDNRRAPPGDPRTLLREAVHAIEAVAGPVQEPPPRHLAEAPEDMSAETLDALVRHVPLLRAIRGHTLSPELWGATMGRMRWLAGRLGDRAQQLRKWLDPEFRPPVESTRGAAQAEQQRARRDALKQEVGGLGDAAALGAWLLKSFDAFNTQEIAGLLDANLRALVQTQGDDLLPDGDRRLRRRLRDLRAFLHNSGEAAAGDGPSEPTEPPAADEPEQAADEPDEGDDPLVVQVRSRVAGKSALFVSNRDDPDLKARLEDRLDLKITWCDGNPRKVQAQCDAIARRSYDLVLIATGFQAHTIDGILARAARAVSVPYVRVFKGRPLACVRALARTFGLAESHAA